MNDLFKPSDATNAEEIKSYKEHLVGEGKKFKDEEALARAKWEADEFIKKVTAENDEMRKELATRMTLEEFWEKTKMTQSKTEDRVDNLREEPAAQMNAPKPEDIAEMVRRELNQEKSKSQKAENVEYVRSELTKTWGPNFQDRLVAKAKELGSSVEFLGAMAETQPKAFLQLMVGSTQQVKSASNDYVPPRSAINLINSNSNNQNFAHYEKMRKENPSLYWTPKIQNEMYKAARDLGEDFYKS